MKLTCTLNLLIPIDSPNSSARLTVTQATRIQSNIFFKKMTASQCGCHRASPSQSHRSLRHVSSYSQSSLVDADPLLAATVRVDHRVTVFRRDSGACRSPLVDSLFSLHAAEAHQYGARAHRDCVDTLVVAMVWCRLRVGDRSHADESTDSGQRLVRCRLSA